MSKILAGAVASLFFITAASADPPDNRGGEIADFASGVAVGNGAPAHAKDATNGEVDSGHAFGAAVSGIGAGMGDHASQNGRGQGGGAQANR